MKPNYMYISSINTYTIVSILYYKYAYYCMYPYFKLP